MPRRDRRLAAAAVAIACAVATPAVARAQAERVTPALARAMDLESAGRPREAAAAYRAAIGPTTAASAILGLERAASEIGWSDTVIAVVDSALRTQPANPIVRTVQLRTLRSAGRDGDARTAFEQWVVAAPRDAAPYREYARLLIESGRAPAADSVLRRAGAALGGMRPFAYETAQLRAALNMWADAATAWREAIDGHAELVPAAAFSLAAAPASQRDAVRSALLAAPAAAWARRLLASLAMQWGTPRAAWEALRDLPPDATTLAAWRDFATAAEQSGAWSAARDAWEAAYAADHASSSALHAASSALAAGDAVGALRLADVAGAATGADAPAVLSTRVRALAAAGRAADAEQAIASSGLGAAERGALWRDIAWAWIRAGDLTRARQALPHADLADDDEIGGWIALYEGDFAAARTQLRHAETSDPSLVTARAVLARSSAQRAPAVGAAFLRLARGDSTGAALALAVAAGDAGDAAPLLLATSARILGARRDTAALATWRSIGTTYPQSPEAAEADLELARAYRARRDAPAATERYEHLIITYPESALVPQARRELEQLRGGTP